MMHRPPKAEPNSSRPKQIPLKVHFGRGAADSALVKTVPITTMLVFFHVPPPSENCKALYYLGKGFAVHLFMHFWFHIHTTPRTVYHTESLPV